MLTKAASRVDPATLSQYLNQWEAISTHGHANSNGVGVSKEHESMDFAYDNYKKARVDRENGDMWAERRALG